MKDDLRSGATRDVVAKVAPGQVWQDLGQETVDGNVRTTEALEVPGAGCLVRVQTQIGDWTDDTMCFVPGARVLMDMRGRKYLAGPG